MLNIEEFCTDTSNPRNFWDHVKKLGPKRKSHIPMEVKINNVQYTDNENVLKKWQSDFSQLYNNDVRAFVDDNFYQTMLRNKEISESNIADPLYNYNKNLNASITTQEVEKAIMSSKNGKSAGPDKLPYEVLKNDTIIKALHKLYLLCFSTGKVPGEWLRATISPIPKSAQLDKCEPLNYRGISLLCTSAKIYSSIRNSRVMAYMENNNLLVEEQNGFRRNRACIDHVFSLASILQTNAYKKSGTFTTFIDFKKAFDLIDREALFYKLLQNGIDGKMYWSVKSMYK